MKKIEEKHEDLKKKHDKFEVYERNLNKKFEPVFSQMKQVISEKRVQYTLYLKKQLSKNQDRIQAEKIALERLSISLSGISDKFKNELEHQLEIIKVKDEQSKKIIEE